MIRNIVVGIDGNDTGLNQTLGRARDSLGRFVAGAGQAANGFNTGFTVNISRSLDSFAKKVESVGNKLSLTISAPLALLGRQALLTYGDMDSLRRGLATLEKDGASLQKRLSELAVVARLPGLGNHEVIQFDILLRSAGFSADLSKRSMLAFGNALASVGKGKNELSRVAYQLQQVAGKTGGYGQDLKLITEQAPQVGAALKRAFGTSNTEDLSRSGKTGKEVIEGLVTELLKLPQATGGIKNAFENMQDVVLKVFDTLGGTIANAFNLEGVSLKVTNFITGYIDKFEKLSPATQRVILAVAGLAIAVPPLLAGFGLLATTIIPAIVSGFGLIISPVVLVGGAIAGLAYLIYKNWETIKATLVNSGIWSTLTGLVADAVGAISIYIKKIVSIGKELWAEFGGSIVSIIGNAWGAVVTIFNAVGNILSGIFRTIDGILTGNWEKTWSGLRMIAGTAIGSILELLIRLTTTVTDVFSNLAERAGFKNFANGLRGVAKDANFTAKEITKILQGVKTPALKPIQLPKTGDLKLPEWLTKPFSLMNGFNFGGPNVKDGDNTKNAPKPGKLAPKASDYKERTETYAEKLQAQIEKLQRSAEAKIALGLTVPHDLTQQLLDVTKQLDAYNEKVKKYTELTVDLKPLKPRIDTVFSGDTLKDVAQTKVGMSNFGGQTMSTLPQVASKLDLKISTGSAIEGAKQQLSAAMAGLPKFIQQVGADLTAAAEGAIGGGALAGPFIDAINALGEAMINAKQVLKDGAIGLMEGIGEAIGSGKNPLKAALKIILDIIGDYLIRLGIGMLAAAKVTALAAAFMAAVGGPAAIPLAAQSTGSTLAGGALIVGGGIVKGLASTAFATGGLVYGRTNAIIGEGIGTNARNPEVVAPLDKLKGIIGGGSNGGGGRLYTEISGSDLRIILDRSDAADRDLKGTY